MLEPPECSRPTGTIGETSRERVLLVGPRRRLRKLARATAEAASWVRLPFVGYVDPSGRNRQIVIHARSMPVPTLGRLERLNEVIHRAGATDVVVALNGARARRIHGELEQISANGRGLRVHWIDEQAGAEIGAASDQSHDAPLDLALQRAAKRALDVMAAGLGLALLSPLLLLVAIAILVTSGRPIFYTQTRVGQRGKRFQIWKFRSMRNDAESASGPIWADDHDRRCTRIGAWLRHTNIDELPQLWNVLKGEMSLVGPRPERPCFVEQFAAEHPDYDLRHAVPVGLTGWAQVHGWRGKTSLRKRIQYDLDYIDRWSLWLDLRTLLMTVEHVLFGKTSWPARRSEAPREHK